MYILLKSHSKIYLDETTESYKKRCEMMIHVVRVR